MLTAAESVSCLWVTKNEECVNSFLASPPWGIGNRSAFSVSRIDKVCMERKWSQRGEGTEGGNPGLGSSSWL